MSSVDTYLYQILKITLYQSISLAKKHLKSKRSLTDLQIILVDYHNNLYLASIIRKVIQLISLQSIYPIQANYDYQQLYTMLQRHEASVREHIKNYQQLKLYCDDIEEKNKYLVAANSELLLRTKGTIIELKRENQRLIEKARLFAKLTQTPQETHIRKTLRQDIPCFISRIDSDRDKTDRYPFFEASTPSQSRKRQSFGLGSSK